MLLYVLFLSSGVLLLPLFCAPVAAQSNATEELGPQIVKGVEIFAVATAIYLDLSSIDVLVFCSDPNQINSWTQKLDTALRNLTKNENIEPLSVTANNLRVQISVDYSKDLLGAPWGGQLVMTFNLPLPLNLSEVCQISGQSLIGRVLEIMVKKLSVENKFAVFLKGGTSSINGALGLIHLDKGTGGTASLNIKVGSKKISAAAGVLVKDSNFVFMVSLLLNPGIPFGPIEMKGLKGEVANGYGPNLSPASGQNQINAAAYGGWAQLDGTDAGFLTKWKLSPGTFALGIKAVLAVADPVLVLEPVGFALVINPFAIVITGKGAICNLKEVSGEFAVSEYDLTARMGLSIKYKVLGLEASFKGSAAMTVAWSPSGSFLFEAKADLKLPVSSLVVLTGPVTGSIAVKDERFLLDVYVKLGYELKHETKVIGLKVGAIASMSFEFRFGLHVNPFQITIGVGAEACVEVYIDDLRFGLGVRLYTEVTFGDQTAFKVNGEVYIKLPWPIPKVGLPFDYATGDSSVTPAIEPALSPTALSDDVLQAIHASGRSDKMGSTFDWPDAVFTIAFKSKASPGSVLAMNTPSVETTDTVKISHSIRNVTLLNLDLGTYIDLQMTWGPIDSTPTLTIAHAFSDPTITPVVTPFDITKEAYLGSCPDNKPGFVKLVTDKFPLGEVRIRVSSIVESCVLQLGLNKLGLGLLSTNASFMLFDLPPTTTQAFAIVWTSHCHGLNLNYASTGFKFVKCYFEISLGGIVDGYRVGGLVLNSFYPLDYLIGVYYRMQGENVVTPVVPPILPGNYVLKVDGETTGQCLSAVVAGANCINPSPIPFTFTKKFYWTMPGLLHEWIKATSMYDSRNFSAFVDPFTEKNTLPRGRAYYVYQQHTFAIQLISAAKYLIGPNPKMKVTGPSGSLSLKASVSGSVVSSQLCNDMTSLGAGTYDFLLFTSTQASLYSCKFSISRFLNFVDHLALVSSAALAGSATQTNFVAGASAGDLKALNSKLLGCLNSRTSTLSKPLQNDDRVPKALQPDWILDVAHAPHPGTFTYPPETNDGDLFLDFFKELGIVPTIPVTPVSKNRIDLIQDPSLSGVRAFWLRLVEPFDWRRVTITAQLRFVNPVASGNTLKCPNRRTKLTLDFAVRTVVSPDSASALLFLETEGKLAKVPRGIFTFKVKWTPVSELFDLQCSQPTTTTFTVLQPQGPDWPTTADVVSPPVYGFNLSDINIITYPVFELPKYIPRGAPPPPPPPYFVVKDLLLGNFDSSTGVGRLALQMQGVPVTIRSANLLSYGSLSEIDDSASYYSAYVVTVDPVSRYYSLTFTGLYYLRLFGSQYESVTPSSRQFILSGTFHRASPQQFKLRWYNPTPFPTQTTLYYYPIALTSTNFDYAGTCIDDPYFLTEWWASKGDFASTTGTWTFNPPVAGVSFSVDFAFALQTGTRVYVFTDSDPVPVDHAYIKENNIVRFIPKEGLISKIVLEDCNLFTACTIQDILVWDIHATFYKLKNATVSSFTVPTAQLANGLGVVLSQETVTQSSIGIWETALNIGFGTPLKLEVPAAYVVYAETSFSDQTSVQRSNPVLLVPTSTSPFLAGPPPYVLPEVLLDGSVVQGVYETSDAITLTAELNIAFNATKGMCFRNGLYAQVRFIHPSFTLANDSKLWYFHVPGSQFPGPVSFKLNRWAKLLAGATPSIVLNVCTRDAWGFVSKCYNYTLSITLSNLAAPPELTAVQLPLLNCASSPAQFPGTGKVVLQYQSGWAIESNQVLYVFTQRQPRKETLIVDDIQLNPVDPSSFIVFFKLSSGFVLASPSDFLKGTFAMGGRSYEIQSFPSVDYFTARLFVALEGQVETIELPSISTGAFIQETDLNTWKNQGLATINVGKNSLTTPVLANTLLTQNGRFCVGSGLLGGSANIKNLRLSNAVMALVGGCPPPQPPPFNVTYIGHDLFKRIYVIVTLNSAGVNGVRKYQLGYSLTRNNTVDAYLKTYEAAYPAGRLFNGASGGSMIFTVTMDLVPKNITFGLAITDPTSNQPLLKSDVRTISCALNTNAVNTFFKCS